MFDLIREKYDPMPQGVEMQSASVQTTATNVVAVEYTAGRRVDYPPVIFNLAMFICGIILMTYGAVHLHDCPAEKRIAISVIVVGALTFLSRLLNSPYELRSACGVPNVPKKKPFVLWLTLIVQFVIIGWLFAMAYFVYSVENHINTKDPEASNYCDEQYYREVFWGAAIVLIAAGVTIIGIIVFMCCCARKTE